MNIEPDDRHPYLTFALLVLFACLYAILFIGLVNADESSCRMHVSFTNGSQSIFTGVIVESNYQASLVVSCAHWVEPGAKRTSVRITPTGHGSYDGYLIGWDKSRDISTFAIKPGKTFQARPLRVSDLSGEKLYHTGYEHGAFVATRKTGKVTGQLRTVPGNHVIYQASFTVQQGASGGPVYDSKGYTVGIVQAQTAEYPNYGLFMPASEVLPLVQTQCRQGGCRIFPGILSPQLNIGSFNNRTPTPDFASQFPQAPQPQPAPQPTPMPAPQPQPLPTPPEVTAEDLAKITDQIRQQEQLISRLVELVESINIPAEDINKKLSSLESDLAELALDVQFNKPDLSNITERLNSLEASLKGKLFTLEIREPDGEKITDSVDVYPGDSVPLWIEPKGFEALTERINKLEARLNNSP